MRLYKYCFSSYFYPLFQHPLMIFLGTVTTVVFSKGWFSMSIIPSLFMNWKSFHFSLIYLFNHVHISVWTHVYLLYALGYTPILLYLFCCTNCSNFSHWVLFQVGSWIPLACPIIFVVVVEHFLLSGTIRCSRLILYICYCTPFFQGEFYLEIKIWALHAIEVIASRSSQCFDLGSICVYT